MTLWHGLQLAYRPRGPAFNRLLRGAAYVVLNPPGVRMRWSVGFRFSLPPCDDSSLARRLGNLKP